jgi:hypothetical protein
LFLNPCSSHIRNCASSRNRIAVNEHRIRNADEYAKHVVYLWMNPVRAGLAEHPEEYPYSSAQLKAEVDPAPEQFQPKSRG